MTKSKSSVNSAMEAIPASTTLVSSVVTSNGTTSSANIAPSVTATPVSTTSASKDATSITSSAPTSASTTVPSPKATEEDMTPSVIDTISAIKENSASAKGKEPAPSSSASTEAAPINSLSATSASTTAPTAKRAAKGTEVTANDVASASDQKSAAKQNTSPEVSQGFVKPKVVEKIFDLPVVSDTYDSLVKLSSPLSPYVEKIGTLASPVLDQALNFRARIEDKVPEGVQTGYTTTLNKVVTAAVSLDATLCSGVDTLVEKVPALKQATPILFNSTRESVGSYATLVATYLASFTIAQVFLKAADLGLETTDGLLKLTASEKVDPILRGLRRVRSEATSLRKEGIVLNGTVKAKTLEEGTLIGAMMEIFGLGSFFNQPGNSRDEDEGLPEDEDAIDVVAMLPSKTRSGLVL